MLLGGRGGEEERVAAPLCHLSVPPLLWLNVVAVVVVVVVVVVVAAAAVITVACFLFFIPYINGTVLYR